MRGSDFLKILRQNVGRNPKHYIFASVGIVVGVAMLSFFVALGGGVRDRILNNYFPVNQIEIERTRVGVLGVEGGSELGAITQAQLEELGSIEGVVGVFPKQASKVSSRIWGGASLFGQNTFGELFLDGMDPELLHPEVRRRELGTKESGNGSALKRSLPCDVQWDCPTGFRCAEQACVRVAYYEAFQDYDFFVPCGRDRQCKKDELCHVGVCRATVGEGATTAGQILVSNTTGTGRSVSFPSCERREDCQGGRGCLFLPCSNAQDCRAGATCSGGRCTSGPKVCDRYRCRLEEANHQNHELVTKRLSSVDECARGQEKGLGCEQRACPMGTYCAALNATSKKGYCERPVPVLANPLSFDIFNATAASSLGIQRISDPRVLLGVQFHMRLGDSFFKRGLRLGQQWTRVGQLVGFSDKSPLVGVTAPRTVVESINTFYGGSRTASTYDTVILVTYDNADVSQVIHQAERSGFRLAPRSRQARKLANMLRILTQVFAAIALVIVLIAAINIAHTFLMMVTERRSELGIMRALGATSRDVKLIILTEAAFVGLMAGVVGHAIAFGASRLANEVIADQLSAISFLPDDFFIFEPRFLVLSVLGAMIFAVVGALSAARRAASLDPAEVLTSV